MCAYISIWISFPPLHNKRSGVRSQGILRYDPREDPLAIDSGALQVCKRSQKNDWLYVGCYNLVDLGTACWGPTLIINLEPTNMSSSCPMYIYIYIYISNTVEAAQLVITSNYLSHSPSQGSPYLIPRPQQHPLAPTPAHRTSILLDISYY